MAHLTLAAAPGPKSVANTGRRIREWGFAGALICAATAGFTYLDAAYGAHMADPAVQPSANLAQDGGRLEDPVQTALNMAGSEGMTTATANR